MQYKIIQKILGILIGLFSLTLLPPLALAWWTGENGLSSFLGAFFIILSVGLLLWLPVKDTQTELKLGDSFAIVILFWISLGFAGAIPFILEETLNLSLTNAVFESLSGLTTTGATVITGLDTLPRPVLFYRQQLQWLGGMGLIVLAVAILPVLGVGGMQLYKVEIPGPMKSAKMTPRITETARTLWYIYLSLTIACCVCYYLAGMNLFDAVCHSFTTISIGGFSTHDQSLGYFNNHYIYLTAILFMFISGVNFTLHFFAWHNRKLLPYRQDSELQAYILILVIICLISCACILLGPAVNGQSATVIETLFQAVAIATTTGFTITEYRDWPEFLCMLLLFASFIGTCAGSTGGGIKIVRTLLLCKQWLREIKCLIHPSAIFVIKINNKPVEERVINAIWGFFAAYIITFIVLKLLLMLTGMDMLTAFSAVAACLNNLGPGLGDVNLHYNDATDPAKWILCFAMLMGRLEIFTLLVVLYPMFWHK